MKASESGFGGNTVRKLVGLMTLLGFVSANSSGCAQDSKDFATSAESDAAAEKHTDKYEIQSQELINSIRLKGVKDERVLKALASVPRHMFVTDDLKLNSYDDNPLPIGQGQTISQPFIVAYMTEALSLKPEDRVLEIGTGSGYQACVLARLSKDVYSIEIIPELAEKAKQVLTSVGVDNVHVKTGDGYKGWDEHAPYDAIIITAAPPEIPQKLIDQLKVGGRLIAPVGDDGMQWLVRLTKRAGDKVTKETLLPVRFVPMVPGKEPKPKKAK